MVETHTNRRLAAILAADVVGYSRMMGADEAGTLTALKHHREAVFDPAVAAAQRPRGQADRRRHAGRVRAASSTRSSAPSPSSVRSRPKPKPAGITLRIGVNLGDVIIDGDDIYGDGVNVAARLEPLAEPGGVCVSSIVNESVGNRIDVAFKDGGEVSVKNIDRPIRVWKWHPDSDPVVRSARGDSVAIRKGAARAALDRGPALQQHVGRS